MSELYSGYHHLTHHIVPGPQSLSYFVPLLLLPLALLIPRTVLSRWQNISTFMPIMTACTIHACWQMEGVDVISVDVLLWALLLLGLKDPWKDFRYIHVADDERTTARKLTEVNTGLPEAKADGEVDELKTMADTITVHTRPDINKATSEEPYPETLWQRLRWVGTLLVSIRFTNWKINVSHHDRAQPLAPAFRTRMAFARFSLLCFLRGYLVLDLTRAYIEHDPYFTFHSLPISSPLPYSQLNFIPPQLLRTMIIGAQCWALIGQMFYLPCLLPVGLNALGLLPDDWSPHNWPPYFGSPNTIFTHGVRGFWGQYWHQTMRWSVAGPGYAAADALGLTSGGLARHTIVTATAFALSGFVHMGLVPPQPLHATMSVNTIRLCVAGFFWTQPIGILVETLVAPLILKNTTPSYWRSGAGQRFRQLVNGIWVIAWFALTLPLLGEMGRQLGYWRVWPMPVSWWRGLHGQRWVVWPYVVDGSLKSV